MQTNVRRAQQPFAGAAVDLDVTHSHAFKLAIEAIERACLMERSHRARRRLISIRICYTRLECV